MNVIPFNSDLDSEFESIDFDTSALPDAYDTLELGSRTLDARAIGANSASSSGDWGDGGYADDPTMRMIDAWLRATEPARW